MAKLQRSKRASGRRAGWWSGAATLLVLALGGCSDIFPPSYEYSTLEVTASRRNGDPVPGVELVLYSGQRHMGYGATDPSGRHVFRHLPQGDYGVGVVAPAGYQVPWGELAYRDQIVVERDTLVGVSFTFLKIGDGAIRVRTVEPSGQPVPGVNLSLYTFRGPVSTGVTDAQGSYTFRPVPFGQYGVRIESTLGYRLRQRYLDGVDVEEGSEETLTFQLDRCEGRVRVRTVGTDGRPIGGVPLVLYTFRGEVARGRTDATGSHEFQQVKCGVEYGVRVELPTGLKVAQGGRDFVDAIDPAREPETLVTFQLERCYGSVVVRVVDRAGSPVAGAGLTLYTFRGAVAEGRADAAGRFTFSEVPCDQYGVRVAPPAGYAVQPGPGSTYIDAIDVVSGSERSLRFVLDRS